jgi:hypothetical protein
MQPRRPRVPWIAGLASDQDSTLIADIEITVRHGGALQRLSSQAPA